jgi:hypothetical protein
MEIRILDKREQWLSESVSVHDLLYGEGPESILEKVRPSSVQEYKPLLRWFHLPANNVCYQLHKKEDYI